jgi:N-acetylglucosaminyldiphosphoundecaprenol N-acetyl-beta-D-mannosaminyltransferase
VSATTDIPQVHAFETRFDAISQAETVRRVFMWRTDSMRVTRTIVTVNVAILMMMRSDRKLAQAVDAADLVVIDGTPLVWACRWLGVAVPERVPGVDLMDNLLAEGSRRSLRVFLLGTTQERLDRLVQVIGAKYPGVTIAGARNGYFKREDDADVASQIRESRADLLLLGMPAPFKEIWCEQHREALCTPAVLGVGGSFDVLAGFVTRAPKPLQNAGLEWAWRLSQEPGKLWKRYLVTNSMFIGLLARKLAGRLLTIK